MSAFIVLITSCYFNLNNNITDGQYTDDNLHNYP